MSDGREAFDTLQLTVKIYKSESAKLKQDTSRRRRSTCGRKGQPRQLWRSGGSLQLRPQHPNERRYDQKDKGSTKRFEEDEGGDRGGQGPRYKVDVVQQC